MLEKTVESLRTGIHVDGHTIYTYKTYKGRFREEQDIEIHVRNNSAEAHMLYAKVFHGRPPEYSPWVELFEINERLRLGGRTTSYFDSPFEDSILKLFADNLAAGAKMFVEYYNDDETRAQLEAGMPVVICRLGHKMFKLGFTWFKDWYFPEGYMEGNQKLQGEKPLNSNVRKRHALSISRELALFSQISARVDTTRIYLKRASERMKEISTLLEC
jgi:hypothetical protein